MVLPVCSRAARGGAMAHGIFHAAGSRRANRRDHPVVEIHTRRSFRAAAGAFGIHHAVGDEVGLFEILDGELLHGTGHLIAHGLHHDIVLGMQACHAGGRGEQQGESGDSHGYFPPSNGAGRMGMRSCDLAFFWTSICVTKMAGEAAETGTPPDSAPQTPLNPATFLSAATILLKVVSGVPIRSAPRTSSSRPSG